MTTGTRLGAGPLRLLPQVVPVAPALIAVAPAPLSPASAGDSGGTWRCRLGQAAVAVFATLLPASVQLLWSGLVSELVG